MGKSEVDPYRVLSHPIRRCLLFDLVEKPQMDLTEREGVDISEIDQRKSEVKAFHTHLPILEDNGLIDWDKETQSVSRGATFEKIRPLLKLLQEHRDELPEDWV